MVRLCLCHGSFRFRLHVEFILIISHCFVIIAILNLIVVVQITSHICCQPHDGVHFIIHGILHPRGYNRDVSYTNNRGYRLIYLTKGNAIILGFVHKWHLH